MVSLTAAGSVALERIVDQCLGSVAVRGRPDRYIFALLHGLGDFFRRLTFVPLGGVFTRTFLAVAAGQKGKPRADSIDTAGDPVWDFDDGNDAANTDMQMDVKQKACERKKHLGLVQGAFCYAVILR